MSKPITVSEVILDSQDICGKWLSDGLDKLFRGSDE